MEEESKKVEGGHKNNKSVLLIILLVLAVGITCSVLYLSNNNSDDNNNNNNVTSSTDKKKVSEYRLTGNNLQDFDLAFLKLEEKEENVIYSPLSIKYALEMLAEGSNGETKDEIDAIIGDYVSKKYINSANMSFANAMFIKETFKDSVKSEYTTNLQDKYNAEVIFDSFENANNMNKWVKDKTLGLISDLFDDSVKDEDFELVNALGIDMSWKYKLQSQSGGKTPNLHEYGYHISYLHEKNNRLNKYTGEETVYYDSVQHIMDKRDFEEITFNGKEATVAEIAADINNYDIVTELGEDNIRNTIKAKYEEFVSNDECGFRNKSEYDSYFGTADEVANKYVEEISQNYKMVDSSTDFKFYDDDNVMAFAKELQEYDGTTLEYVGIMPKQVNLKDYIKDTTSNNINNIINNLKDIKLENFEKGYITRINGSIPFFKFESSINLKDDLNKLGVVSAFDQSKADLSNLTSSKGTFISSANHKANIDFSNEGIKAAAATSMGGMGAADGCTFDYLYEVPIKDIDLTFDKPYMFIIRDINSGEVWFTGTVYEPSLIN